MAERALTPEDRDKIRRLLETADPDNVRLAVSLLEETANDEDVDEILSDDVILPLVASGDLQILVRTGQLALGAESVWKRFSHWATELNVVESRSFVEHLTSLSDAAAESLSKHKGWLNLNGLTSLSDAAAESLGKHSDGTLSLNGLTSLSDAATVSLGKHWGKIYHSLEPYWLFQDE